MAEGEGAVGFLADKLGESQPKISRHLAYLRTAGLVSTRRDGKWIYYGIEDQEDAAVSAVLTSTLRSILGENADHDPRSYIANDGDAYVYHDAQTETLPEHEDDWAPAEMEIFLL